MKRIAALFLLALLLPCAVAGVRPLTLDDLCSRSTRIVRGVVGASRVRLEAGTIVTHWSVEPLENLKGTGRETFSVKVPGGRIGKLEMHASEAPRMRTGEEVVLFLRPGVARCDVYGWFRGKYTVVNGRIREQRGTTCEAFLKAIRAKVAAAGKGR